MQRALFMWKGSTVALPLGASRKVERRVSGLSATVLRATKWARVEVPASRSRISTLSATTTDPARGERMTP